MQRLVADASTQNHRPAKMPASMFAEKPRALELVRIDNCGRCCVQDEGASFLRGISGQLGVVCIAGLSRTGKSFLLNRLLGRQDGFAVGPTVNACTKGLWVWSEVVELGPNRQCVFVDTEGLGSLERSGSADLQIFLLGVLISSYFIYNSAGPIDARALDDLHMVSQLAKHSSSKDRQELSRPLPKLLWVLRDFHLKLVEGVLCDRDYLEHALRPDPKDAERNTVREAIRGSFFDRDCVTLPRPAVEESVLRDLERLSVQALRPEFREKATALTKLVYSSVDVKTIGGIPVTGSMLAALTLQYCETLSAGSIPTINSAWSLAIEVELKALCRKVVETYRARMNVLLMRVVDKQCFIPEDELHVDHLAFHKEALAQLAAQHFVRLDDPLLHKYASDAEDKIMQLYNFVKEKNRDELKRACEQEAAFACDALLEMLRSLSGQDHVPSLVEFAQDWDEACQTFQAKAPKCPVRLEISATMMRRREREAGFLLWEKYSEHFKKQADEQRAESERLLLAARTETKKWKHERTCATNLLAEFRARMAKVEAMEHEKSVELEFLLTSARDHAMRLQKERDRALEALEELKQLHELKREQECGSTSKSTSGCDVRSRLVESESLVAALRQDAFRLQSERDKAVCALESWRNRASKVIPEHGYPSNNHLDSTSVCDSQSPLHTALQSRRSWRRPRFREATRTLWRKLQRRSGATRSPPTMSGRDKE